MACQRDKAGLRDAALEALDPAEALELKTHLEVCAECRAEFERERLLLAAINRRLSTALEASPSPQFVARVRTRLAAESARPKTVLPRWVLAAAGALAACALVVAWFGHEKSPGRPSKEAKLATPSAGPTLRVRRAPPLIERRYKAIRRAEPEVLIDPAAEQSLARFYNALCAGRVDASSLITVPAGFERREDGSLVPKPLEIEPLKIATLQVELVADSEETKNIQ